MQTTVRLYPSVYKLLKVIEGHINANVPEDPEDLEAFNRIQPSTNHIINTFLAYGMIHFIDFLQESNEKEKLTQLIAGMLSKARERNFDIEKIDYENLDWSINEVTSRALEVVKDRKF
jgi:uncharacterized Rmd1/YagE family protein